MILIGSSGKTYTIAENNNAHAGGEGTVFEVVGEPNLVVKIYHQPDPRREQKILRMISARPSRVDDFAWPLDAVYSADRGEFLGFVMQKVKGVPLRDIVVYDKRKGVPWSFYVLVAANIATAVQSLHEAGHVVGDLNPNNVLVDTGTGVVRLIDTDSFHIIDRLNGEVYPCVVGQPECLAPELQGIGRTSGESFRTIPPDRSFNVDTDLFSLAIMIFRTLMNGAHPFNSVIKGVSQSTFTCEDRIEQGVCAFFPETADPNSSLPAYAPSIDALPRSTQDLFRRVFVYRNAGFGALTGAVQMASSAAMRNFFQSGPAGYSSTVVSAKGRPLAEEWRAELLALGQPGAKNLVQCKKVPTHEYTRERKRCPWCEADARFQQANIRVAPQQAYVPPMPMGMPVPTGFTSPSSTSIPTSISASTSSASAPPHGSGSAPSSGSKPSFKLPRPPAGLVKALVAVAVVAGICFFFNIDVFGFIKDTSENVALNASRSTAQKEAPSIDEIPMAASADGPLYPAFAKAPQNSAYADYGYINAQGEWVLKPTFDDKVISTFSEGLALSYDSLSQLYGYVDTSGQYVLRPTFSSAADTFSEGVAWVNVERNTYTFINKAGEQIINDSWDDVTDFSEGKAWVYSSWKASYRKTGDYKGPVIIDKAGNVVGFLNSNGNSISASDVQAFNSGRARVQINSKYGFTDENGTVVIQPVYSRAASFSEGLAAVYDSEKHLWGYIDTAGNTVILPRFKAAGPFSEGLAAVETDNGYGYIDSTGQFVIEPQFMIGCEFSGGYAPARDKETSLYALIDKTGNWVFPPKFTMIKSSMVFRQNDIQTPETGTF